MLGVHVVSSFGWFASPFEWNWLLSKSKDQTFWILDGIQSLSIFSRLHYILHSLFFCFLSLISLPFPDLSSESNLCFFSAPFRMAFIEIAISWITPAFYGVVKLRLSRGSSESQLKGWILTLWSDFSFETICANKVLCKIYRSSYKHSPSSSIRRGRPIWVNSAWSEPTNLKIGNGFVGIKEIWSWEIHMRDDFEYRRK